MPKCSMGECGISCPPPYGCYSVGMGPIVILDGKNKEGGIIACTCDCFLPRLSGDRPIKPIKRPKGGKKFPFMRFKRMIKENPQTKFSVCAHDMPIIGLAQAFDKILPDRILVPANNVDKKVTLSLKNKTIREIIISIGLTLKS
jgi:hypothetical protein